MKSLLGHFFFIIISFTQISGQHRGAQAVSETEGNKVISIYDGSYALLIGNSEYQNPNWANLNGVEEDIIDIKNTLEKIGFQTIVKKNLTKIEIEDVLKDFIINYGLEENNQILVYYAGHGMTSTNKISQRKNSWLIPVDQKDADESTLLKNAYNVNRIINLAEETVNAKHALFLFDACFSGAIFNSKSRPQPNFLNQETQKPLRYFITSGDENEEVPDKSEFKKLFLKAFNSPDSDFNQDGYITEEELAIYFSENIQGTVPQFGTIPNSDLDEGDFVFVLPEAYRPKKVTVSTGTKKSMKGYTKIGVRPVMVKLPGGRFVQGSDEGSIMSKPAHSVNIGNFSISKFEITNYQYCKFLNEKGNKKIGGISWVAIDDPDCQIEYRAGIYEPKLGFEDYPVVEVTWHGAKAYSEWAGGRLPTESEWEYAAKANSDFIFSGSDSIEEIGWYLKNSNGATHPVGMLNANDFGLYDMTGNVAEWVEDDWHLNYDGAPKNGLSWKNIDESKKVIRGSSYHSSESRSSINYRLGGRSSRSDANIGFRICFD